MAAEGIGLKRERCFTVRSPDLLLLEIDLEVKALLSVFRQLTTLLLREDHGEHAVLHAVIAEDVREAGGNNAADAEVQSIARCQRPDMRQPTRALTNSKGRAHESCRSQSSCQ